jgi:hypothetical protein
LLSKFFLTFDAFVVQPLFALGGLRFLTPRLALQLLVDNFETAHTSLLCNKCIIIIIIIIISCYPLWASTKRRHLVLSLAILFTSLHLFPYRTRTGVFSVVWPLASNKYLLQCYLPRHVFAPMKVVHSSSTWHYFLTLDHADS